ncbi:MAG: Arc family DNA-binding protein [Betaproteobacteria bacterium]|nr:Arc family DNA-binding protein [Betaproteobacteria bacterium]
MPVNLSVKNVPEALAARLRRRAERNHRSLQGELMAILESAARESATTTGAPVAAYAAASAEPPGDRLLARLLAIAGDRGVDASKRLTREEAHDRASLRKRGA